jgi:hypothetical protein
MASNQPTQALNVAPSDTINIPEPDAYITGTKNSTGTTITDTSANFLGTTNPAATGYANRVSVGDVVYVYAAAIGSAVTMVTVVSVTDNNNLVVSATVPNGVRTYEIYRSNGNFKNVSEGFSLFVGGGGTGANLAVVPACSDQVVLLENIPDSSFIPLQVKRVNSTGTTATKIIALR